MSDSGAILVVLGVIIVALTIAVGVSLYNSSNNISTQGPFELVAMGTQNGTRLILVFLSGSGSTNTVVYTYAIKVKDHIIINQVSTSHNYPDVQIYETNKVPPRVYSHRGVYKFYVPIGTVSTKFNVDVTDM